MGAKEKMTSLGRPVPELPVADVECAQQHYRDALGFEIKWLEPDKGIGAVSRGDMGPIFFRKRTPPFEPAVHWVFAEDIDGSYQELTTLPSATQVSTRTLRGNLTCDSTPLLGRKSWSGSSA